MTIHEKLRAKAALATVISLPLLSLVGCNSSIGVASIPGTGPLAVRPTVATTTPAADDNRIALSANLDATFSKALLLSSVDSSQFTLHRSGVLIPAQVTFDGTTAVLNPDDDLLASTHYTVSLNSGIVGNDGLALTPHQWSFYTDGNGWTPDELIEFDDAGGGSSSQISFDSNGNAFAVWRQSDGTRYNIYANRYTASSSRWGTAALIETDDAGNASSPQISFDSNGNAFAVWTHHDGTRYNIYANRYTASSSSWGTATLIEADDTGNAFAPQISFDNNGNALAVWQQHDGSRYNIVANRYSVSTDSWFTAAMIEFDNAGDATDPQISTDANGNALAVWRQNDGTLHNIIVNRYSASIDSWGTAALIDSVSAGSADTPQICIDTHGNAIAVWQQHDGTRNSIYANRYTASSNSWALAALIETDDAGRAARPQISIDSDGNALVVWLQLNGTYSIVANHYSASTDSWGAAELIESDNAGNAYDPQISLDTGGNAIAVWSQDDGTRFNIYANRYTASTHSWGTVAVIESDNAGDATYPQISADANGNALAVWGQNDGTRDNIVSAGFDPRVVAP